MGYFGSFWVIFGLFFGTIFLAKYASVLFKSFFATLLLENLSLMNIIHLKSIMQINHVCNKMKCECKEEGNIVGNTFKFAINWKYQMNNEVWRRKYCWRYFTIFGIQLDIRPSLWMEQVGKGAPEDALWRKPYEGTGLK